MVLHALKTNVLTTLSLLTCLLAIWIPQSVQAQIELRVSVKFVMGPGGEYPGSSTDPNCTDLACSAVSCEQEVQDKIDYGNAVLAKLGYGYRISVVEYIEVVMPEPDFACCEGGDKDGSTCFFTDDCPGPDGTCVPIASWFDAPSKGCTFSALNRWAEEDPAAIEWNFDAINIYVINTCKGGYGGRAPGQAIVIGQAEDGAFVRWLHEIGHFLSLCHTHGPCPGCEAGEDPDCLDDTILDDETWDTADLIAQGNGYTGYADPTLTCEDRQGILDVLYNIMSYHQDHELNSGIVCDPSLPDVPCSQVPPPDLCRHRLTPDQLDLMADLSNTLRRNVSTGCMIFVDASANAGDLLGVHACEAAVGFCDGSGVDVCCDLDGDGLIEEPCAALGVRPHPDLDGNSTRPYPTVGGALAEANPGDVLMIRGGSYDESLTIQRNVTLRASRGDALIGTSGP